VASGLLGDDNSLIKIAGAAMLVGAGIYALKKLSDRRAARRANPRQPDAIESNVEREQQETGAVGQAAASGAIAS
jgi:hypothetical protein